MHKDMTLQTKRKMNYTKFIILGQGRTGSNLLLILLASHRNVFSVGEVFNPAEGIREKIEKIAKPLTLYDDPIEYLENYIYKMFPDHIKAVGFKLFYEHARNDEWKEVWEYLRRSRVKIIHLKRKNLLDRYLSHQLAVRSNMWINFKKGNNAVNEPITLNPQDCFKDFHTTLRRQKQANDFFKDSPKLEVIYEELVSDFAGESRRLLHFLGLGYQELTTTTRKQRTRKKSEIIANYDQLKNVLVQGVSNGKEWAKEEWLDFFDEDGDEGDFIIAAKDSLTKLVGQKIRYHLAEAGEIFFVWGIDGWHIVPEEIRPVGTVVKNSVMHTPMEREGDTFVAKVRVASGTTIVYGFLITKHRNGTDIKAIWDRHQEDIIITQDGVADVQAPLVVIKEINNR